MNMRTSDNIFRCVVIFLLLLSSRQAEATDVFATCRVMQSTLSWGEPFSITLAVYTRTWFTEGVFFPEMEKQNGVLLKSGRSHTLTETIGGERYSVIEQNYIYYPFEPGEQLIRFGELTVYSPLPNEYQGAKHTLVIPPKKIEVRIPHAQSTHVTTAHQLKVEQDFDLPDTLHAGDVVARTLRFSASGVPAAFIVMPQVADTLKQIRTTREQPEYATDFHRGNVSGRAVQRILYQPVDSGTFVLPQITVNYWSLKSRRMEKIVLEGKTVYVLSPKGGFPTQKKSVTGKPDYSDLAVWSIAVVSICMAAFFLGFGIYRLVRRVRYNPVWKVLIASGYPQLYDALYVYAQSRHFDSFQELVRVYPDLQNWYEGFQIRLFKDGCTGSRNILRLKCLLLMALFCSRCSFFKKNVVFG